MNLFRSLVGRILRAIPLLLLAIVMAFGGACTSTDIDPPTTGTTTGGTILVDTPEVYGRERLIRDREQQKKWLLQQLDVSNELFDTFEALVQSRTSSSSTASLGIDASPAAGLAIRQAESQADALHRTSEVAELEHQIRIAELQAELGRVQAGGTPMPTSTPSPAAPASSTTSTPATPGTTPTPPPTATPSAAPAQPSTFTIDPLSAKSDPTSRLIDRLAYREIVRQELLENDLDDIHDLHGNTLYRLTFDSTVFPNQDTSAWAVVHVAVGPSTTCDLESEQNWIALQRLKDQWLHHLNDTLDLAVSDLEARLDRAERDEPIEPEFRILVKLAQEKMRDVERDRPGEAPLKQRRNAAARAVAQFYRDTTPRRAGGLINFDAHLGTVTASIISRHPYLKRPGESRGPHALQEFCELLSILEQTTDAYAVTPKEAVQRVASATAFEAAQERALSLAAVAGTVGIDAAVEAIREANFRAQSILRQPLVVGYSGLLQLTQSTYQSQVEDQGTQFGWILGPRFKARSSTGGFDFRHSTVQRPLSAVVSVPGWWTNLTLTVTTCWIDESLDGTPRGRFCSSRDSQQMSIRLAGDVSEITHALFPRPKYPLAQLLGQPDIEIGRPEAIVLLGTNLWRNPTVALDNQIANAVEILPDMKGVVATFNKVAHPAGWTNSQTFSFADLTIWTSEGSTQALGRVRLHKPVKPADKNSPEPQFKVSTSATAINAHQGGGTVSLLFDLHPKSEIPAISKVFIGVEGADPDLAGSSGACLTPNTDEVTGSCRVTLSLKNLIHGKVITLTFHRLDGTDKVFHSPISLEVR